MTIGAHSRGQKKEIWTFDRIMAVLNMIVMICGGIWALRDWRDFTRDYDKYILTDSKITADSDAQNPFDYDGDLEVNLIESYDDGTNLYDVSFDIRNTNKSKSQIAVSYSISELYLGEARTLLLSPGAAAVINDPPDPWHPIQQDGYIRWKRVSYEADIIGGNHDSRVAAFVHKDHPITGDGGLAAELPTGTSEEYTPEFLIRARPDQYIAVIVSFGVNDTIDFTSAYTAIIDQISLLSDAAIAEKSRTNAMITQPPAYKLTATNTPK